MLLYILIPFMLYTIYHVWLFEIPHLDWIQYIPQLTKSDLIKKTEMEFLPWWFSDGRAVAVVPDLQLMFSLIMNRSCFSIMHHAMITIFIHRAKCATLLRWRLVRYWLIFNRENNSYPRKIAYVYPTLSNVYTTCLEYGSEYRWKPRKTDG